jgi:hypothetical protein
MFAEVVHRVEPNKVFGHRLRLDLEEPPHVLGGELLVCVVVHCQCWCDVEKRNLLHGVGVIEAQPVCDAAAAIVSR